MTDKIIAQFKASHSARGMYLSARQTGVIKPKKTPPPKAKVAEQAVEEETDIQ